jgi:hypothetical protein
MPPEIIHTPTYRQTPRPSGSALLNFLLNIGVLVEPGAGRKYRGVSFKRRLLRLLAADLVRGRISPLEFYRYVSYYVESTRHLETHFCHENLERMSQCRNYLDISSPRVIPYFFTRSLRLEHATLCNPDVADLELTQHSVGRGRGNVTFRPVKLQELDRREQFDLITSVSVVEHISPDQTAEFMSNIVERLARGGLCLLTFPCARQEIHEYRDVDPYTTQAFDEKSERYFFQKHFTSELVRREILRGFGEVLAHRVFGERETGQYRAYEESRVVRQSYSSYRDRKVVSEIFSEFSSIEELPGIGVCCYLLRK